MEHDLSEVLSENEQLLTKLEKLMSVLVLHQQNRKDQTRSTTRRATAMSHLYNNVTSMTSVTEDLDAPNMISEVEEIANAPPAAVPPQPVSRALKSARLHKIDKSWTNLNLDTEYSLATGASPPEAPLYTTSKPTSFLTPMETVRQDSKSRASPRANESPSKRPQRDSIAPGETPGFDNVKLRKELEALDRQIANEKI